MFDRAAHRSCRLPPPPPTHPPRGALLVALLAALVLGLGACTDGDPPEGALVVLPILTGGAGRIADDQGATIATITNASAAPLRLALEVVSGDPGEQWHSISLVCDVPGGQTATLLFAPLGDGAQLTASCFDLDFGGFPETRLLAVDAQNGMLVAAVADPVSGVVLSQDSLLAAAVVIDFGAGQAFGLPAARVRAGTGANDGNQVHRFDGLEYKRLPSGVAANLTLPGPGDFTELVLVTLDGTTGLTPPPRVSLGGIGQVLGLDILDQLTFFDFDFSLGFDCFRVVDLLALSSGFTGVPGAPGYLQLTAQPVGAGGSDVHDQAYGDGNGTRRRPVLGWALERRAGVTSARLLDSLPIPLAPFLADEDPVFDTEVGELMVRLAVDFENPSRTWWEGGGQELWDGISEAFDGNAILLDASLAESWLAEARKIPGWDGGPEYAPHPVRVEQVDPEDEILY